LEYRVEWEREFRQELAEIEKIKPVIWCGDLNVAHNEIDLFSPKTSTKSAGFTKEERDCFTELLSDGYFDSYRYLYPDVAGGKSLSMLAAVVAVAVVVEVVVVV
jgi:exodeoxyribonuclease-3